MNITITTTHLDSRNEGLNEWSATYATRTELERELLQPLKEGVPFVTIDSHGDREVLLLSSSQIVSIETDR
ncbi:hypothetical protein WG936_04060 [Corynebacterium sp. H127]|uniref:hypothetical protein n=1 Tax=Corynebacterium sp. H127 TaxID=3133418 RepID=UPI0030AA17D2